MTLEPDTGPEWSQREGKKQTHVLHPITRATATFSQAKGLNK